VSFLDRFRKQAPPPPPKPTEDEEILESLDRLQVAVVGKVPDMVSARIDKVADLVR
jgi:hypothetical protein